MYIIARATSAACALARVSPMFHAFVALFSLLYLLLARAHTRGILGLAPPVCLVAPRHNQVPELWLRLAARLNVYLCVRSMMNQ